MDNETICKICIDIWTLGNDDIVLKWYSVIIITSFKKNSIFGKHQQILYLLSSSIPLKQIGNYIYHLF